ncbi:hypothetical protein K435DRAFT_704507 [Dendrothele bispora CBS 962.96]|uniref:DUF6534 domain-containing protein n=1 Tax=Dendrothele bispora (strain CBS 962.96) TaxID=1314807 RepID=A0A4S8KM35_DENBC|nr:hypothetical protein K435DRAFT_704507 [Dendrothele bispora CBS 962.96]
MSGVPISSLPTGVDLSASIDGFFYGNIIGLLLFGINIVQAWIYINTNKDKWPLRSLVSYILLFFMNIAMFLICYFIVVLVIFFSYVLSSNSQSTFSIAIIEYLITLVITLCVELFFASHVWISEFSFHIYPTFLQILTTLGGTGLSSSNQLEFSLSCSLAAASDIIATIALSWVFSSFKTGIKKTDTLLQKLFRYTVTRGLFVSIDQTVIVIVFLITPASGLWW